MATNITVDKGALDNAVKTATSIKSSIDTLINKGYGNTNLSDLPQGTDISQLPDKSQPTTLTDRYASQRAAIDSAYGDTTTAPNQDTIQDQYRRYAQAQIDAINSKYAAIEASDADTIDLMKRERNASNVLNGLTGSDAAVGRTIQTAKDSEKIQNLTASGKAAEINAVLANADSRASDEFQKEKQNFIQNSKDKLQAEQALNDKIKNNALDEIKTLAGSTSFSDLSPSLLAQYKNETGFDDNTLKAYFLANSGSSLVSSTPEVIGNKAIFFQKAADGTIKQISIDLPTNVSDPKNVQVISNSNGIWMVDKSTGKATQVADTSGGSGSKYVMPKAAKNNLMGLLGWSADDVNKLEADIQQYGLQKAVNGLDDNTKNVIQGQIDKSYSIDVSGDSSNQ